MFTPETLNILLFASIGLVFYFFIIRPQSRRAKEMETFRAALQVGDRVVTNGGLHGRLTKVSEQTVMLEIARNTQIKLEKSAISAELSKSIAKEKEAVAKT